MASKPGCSPKKSVLRKDHEHLPMRILVYKRTHNGDPSESVCFGVYDCLGAVRDREYDAVIGVGGIGASAQVSGVEGQVNWIGIGPHKRYVKGKCAPEVSFDHFVHFGTNRPDFLTLAPCLARRMYGNNVRSVLGGLSQIELAEATEVVRRAMRGREARWPRATAQSKTSSDRCRSKCRTQTCD